jgi:hypothetical protein
MAKFYLQSGNLKAVIDSPDVDRAALWAVHRAMQQILPVQDEDHSPDEKAAWCQFHGTIVLGESIHLSEVGFDHPAPAVVDTLEACHQWDLLMRAIDRLDESP